MFRRRIRDLFFTWWACMRLSMLLRASSASTRWGPLFSITHSDLSPFAASFVPCAPGMSSLPYPRATKMLDCRASLLLDCRSKFELGICLTLKQVSCSTLKQVSCSTLKQVSCSTLKQVLLFPGRTSRRAGARRKWKARGAALLHLTTPPVCKTTDSSCR